MEFNAGKIEKEEFLHIIKKNSEEMLELLNSLLEVSVIESGKFTITKEPIQFDKLVEERIDLYSPNGEKKGIDITKARVIVAGGRGVGNEEGFQVLKKLATLMDGEVAGTRVTVEEGWIPAEHQVGQTGQSVRPEIYIACGISGAIQHRAGMMNSRYIIAINKDPLAPIFQVADWSIVGDLHEVVPEMISQLTKA